MNSSICGYWSIPSSICNAANEIMHISPSGRIVHRITTSIEGARFASMRLWCYSQDDDMYRVKAKLDSDGWLVGMSIVDGDLIIDRSFSGEDEVFVCKPLGDE